MLNVVSMFCVDCGEEKPIFREGSCLQCYIKHHQFAQGPEVFHIPVCTYCDAYKYKNTWREESFERVVKRYVKNAFTIHSELRKVELLVDCHNEEDSIFCKVTIQGKLDDEQIFEDHFVEIRLKPNVCDVCSKRFGGYHEATVQIRSSAKKMSIEERKTIQRFIDQLVHSMQQKGNRQLFVTDKNVEKSGIDYLLSDKQAAASIVKKAQEKFSGEITVSSSNVGMNDGKQVYRMTYLLRLPKFSTHSFLAIDTNLFYVLSLSSNMVHVINVKNWMEHTFQLKDLENCMVYSYEELVQLMIVISQSEKEIQVMNKTNYKMPVIAKPRTVHFTHDQIPVIKYNENFFLLPEINDK